MALDGRVVWGTALVSAEHISGESAPRAACPGDELPAGARAHDGALVLQALRPSAQSAPARIARLAADAQVQDVALQGVYQIAKRLGLTGQWPCQFLILKFSGLNDHCRIWLLKSYLLMRAWKKGRHQWLLSVFIALHCSDGVSLVLAQASRPKLGRWLDRFGEVYSRAVIGTAGLAFVALLIAGVPVLGSGSGHGAAYRAIALLTTASPCALVLVPVAYVAAIAALTNRYKFDCFGIRLVVICRQGIPFYPLPSQKSWMEINIDLSAMPQASWLVMTNKSAYHGACSSCLSDMQAASSAMQPDWRARAKSCCWQEEALN